MFSAILWLLVGLIVLMLVTMWVRKHFLSPADEATPAGFTLGDLRQLHKTGQMSDEEFERAKAQVLAGTKKFADSIPPHPDFRRKVGPPQTRFDVLPPKDESKD